MGVTRTEDHGDGNERTQGDAVPDRPQEDMPTTQLVAGSLGDRCPNCGSPMASDQRYCVVCGERRGKSRFTAPGVAAAAPPAQTVTQTTVATNDPGRRRPSYGPTLVAGIATLLIAMGVGVEIGRISQNSGSGRAPAAQVITVNGGGGTSAGSAAAGNTGVTTPGGGSSGGSSHSAKTHHRAAATPKVVEVKKAAAAAAAPKPTKAAVQKASHAAASVLGGSGGQSNATATTGSSCAAGSAGCQSGHFTGNFFGQ